MSWLSELFNRKRSTVNNTSSSQLDVGRIDVTVVMDDDTTFRLVFLGEDRGDGWVITGYRRFDAWLSSGDKGTLYVGDDTWVALNKVHRIMVKRSKHEVTVQA